MVGNGFGRREVDVGRETSIMMAAKPLPDGPFGERAES